MRLCRPMSGKASPFRRVSQASFSFGPALRKGTAFPLIGRHSRKKEAEPPTFSQRIVQRRKRDVWLLQGG